MILPLLLLMQNASEDSGKTAETFSAVGRAMDDWKICTAKSVRKYALGTKEPAETVVDAAIGECSENYNVVGRILRTADGGGFMTTGDIDGIMDKLMTTWRPKLVAGVLRLRTK